MKLYTVVTDQEVVGTYLDSKLATSHFEHCRQFAREDRGEWVRMDVDDVDRIPGQRIFVSGTVAGYQFDRDSMGSRTIVRTVRDIVQVAGEWIGDVRFLGRTLLVRYDPPLARIAAGRWDSNPGWIAFGIKG